MSKIGLFYSSSTGNTKEAADAIRAAFGDDVVDVFSVADTDVARMLEYDRLIIGIPTWEIGELEADWDAVVDDYAALDLGGRKLAVFGLGDQVGYPDTYQDGIGILARKGRDAGATLVGFTSTEGHVFEASYGVEDGRFMGLALDNDNDAGLTDGRIAAWVEQLKGEFGL
jgi:flavodoxin I